MPQELTKEEQSCRQRTVLHTRGIDGAACMQQSEAPEGGVSSQHGTDQAAETSRRPPTKRVGEGHSGQAWHGQRPRDAEQGGTGTPGRPAQCSRRKWHRCGSEQGRASFQGALTLGSLDCTPRTGRSCRRFSDKDKVRCVCPLDFSAAM